MVREVSAQYQRCRSDALSAKFVAFTAPETARIHALSSGREKDEDRQGERGITRGSCSNHSRFHSNTRCSCEFCRVIPTTIGTFEGPPCVFVTLPQRSGPRKNWSRFAQLLRSWFGVCDPPPEIHFPIRIQILMMVMIIIKRVDGGGTRCTC